MQPWEILFHHISDAVVIIDDSGRLVALNGAAERLFRTPASVAEGLVISDLLPAFQTSQPEAVIDAQPKEGRSFPVRVTCHPTERDGGKASIVILHKHAEEEREEEAAVTQHIVVDNSGIIVSASSTIFGWSDSELVGERAAVLLPSWGEANLPSKIIAISKDGREINATLTVTGVERNGDSVTELGLREAGSKAEVTAWQMVEDILSTSVDPAMLISVVGEVLLFNPAAEKAFGFSRDEVVGHNVNMLMPPEDREAHDGYLRKYAERRKLKGRNAFKRSVIGTKREVVAQKKDGSRFAMQLSLSEAVLPGSDSHVFVGVIHDVSADVAAAKQRVTQTKSFLANTSHELRTPLHAIIGLTETVRGELRPLIEATKDAEVGEMVQVTKQLKESLAIAREDMSIVLQSSWQLLSLVNDLLDYSRLSNSKDDGTFSLTTCPVNIHAEVTTALAVVRNLPDLMHGVELINAVDTELPCVVAEPRRIRQILINLLTNAIKFTEEGSITVSAQLEEDLDGEGAARMRVSVTDTGCGIPADQVKYVFDAFSQAHGSVSAEKGGTGLGLGIAKALVEKHGGHMSIESTEGVGSTLSFDLETTEEALKEEEESGTDVVDRVSEALAEDSAAAVGGRRNSVFVADGALMDRAVARAKKEEDDVGRGKILVVDDNPRNRHLLLRLLTAQNYSVVEAENGMEGLAVWRASMAQPTEENHISLILLDAMMPIMDGFAMLEELRKEIGAEELPVIMLTARTQTEDIVQGLAMGANDYLTKPFNVHELIARVRTHQGLAQLGKAYKRFVPAKFVSLLNSDILDLTVGMGAEMPMTVLFTDIRNFTAISEQFSPTEVFEFINLIFKQVNPIVRRHNGVVDKFIGDCVMALFPGKPEDAVQAAVEIQQALEQLRTRTVGLKVPAVHMGVGVHHGVVMLGTVGDRYRMETTAISDAVNLAARIESLTKQMGVDILISADTVQAMEDSSFAVRPVGSVSVKGRNGVTNLFEVLDAYPEKKRLLRMAHAEALEAAMAAPTKKESAAEFERMAAAGDSVASFHLELCGNYTLLSK